MGARATAACIATASLLALAPAAAQAAAGEPDPSFGNGGFTVLDDPGGSNENLEDVQILPDGKILGAGERGIAAGFLLARFGADGKPDTSFGGEGIKVEPDLNTTGSPREIGAIEMRGDGKLVAAGLGRGATANAYEFGRYLSNGDLDPGFGSGGLTTVSVTPFGQAFALAQTSDRKLVAAGNIGEKAGVVRLTEGGEPDPSFNAVPAGVREVDVPNSFIEEARAVSILPEDKVLIGGFSGAGAFLAELDRDGNPVAGFGNAGIAVADLGESKEPTGEINDLKVLSDGRILAAGASLTAAGDEQMVVARFNANGELDSSFADGGVFHANPSPKLDEAQALEVLPDGRILAAGTARRDPKENGQAWVVRLTPEGQLDTSFGSGGEAVVPTSVGSTQAFGLAVQPDGKAVIAGNVEAAGGAELLVGRFTADAAPVKGPPPTPKAKCAGKRATIVGTGRSDRIHGTGHRDVIAALGGNDRVIAGGGNDLICAGKGKDLVKAGAGRDTIRGEAGPDTLLGGAGNDTLLGSLGTDRLFGNAGTDLCNGGSGTRDHAAGSCEHRRKIP